MNNSVLICDKITKSYTTPTDRLDILTNIDLEVLPNQTISIVGSSGSGKSTLLHILAGLDEPTSGNVIFDGKDIHKLNEKEICKTRNNSLGFIYQFHHLLAEFNAIENILMPLTIAGNNSAEANERAKYILNKLNLYNRRNNFPSQLSGGERQRVAVGRAIINNPKLILADEPTGNLDNFTAHQVLDMFFELQQEFATSLIIVTHDLQIANKTQTSYLLKNGELLPN